MTLNQHKNYATIASLKSETVGKLINRIPGTRLLISKIVSEYDQEIPQSQTTENPVAPQGRAAQPSPDTRKTN